MSLTVYQCPVTSCGWTHSSEVTPGVPGWEKFFTYQHSHTHYSFQRDHLVRLYLDIERVLYSHLAVHTPYEWMLTLREAMDGQGVLEVGM